MDIRTVKAFARSAEAKGFKVQFGDRRKDEPLLAITSPGGKEFHVSLYPYHGYMYARRNRWAEDSLNTRLHNLKEARRHLDRIIELEAL